MTTPRAQLKELRRHRVPAWFQDAKLGIFVHWTPASVPGFAPVDSDVGDMLRSGRDDAMAWSPYTEWYENSLRFPDSPVSRHHRETYGDRPYRDFAGDWESALDQWDPDAWARRFAASGARYVVLVTKHHDGYCLWPTDVANPHRPGWHCRRDVVGELAEAVRGVGMRFGIYYSGGLDWTFDARPMGSLADMLAAIPRADYPAYAEAQMRELISRYRPSVLWNDIAWPASAKHLWPLFDHYYDAVPDGVVNDRWMPWNPLIAAARLGPVGRAVDAGSRRSATKNKGLIPPKPPFFDFRTPEYTVFPDVQRSPWECVRGMDHSFGYNAASRPEDFVTRADLLWSLVDISAKGGNLLLNVGPRGVDAQIPEEQTRRLEWLAEWMGAYESALRATRPWVRPGVETGEGARVRYTARDETVFAMVDGASGTTTLGDIEPTRTTTVQSLDGTKRPWRATPEGLQVELGASGDAPGPTAVALARVEARP